MKDTPIRAEEKAVRKIRHWYFTMMILFNVMAMALILLAIYWSVYPYKTTIFKDKTFPITTKVVKQGKVLQYISDYCKYTNLPAETSCFYINDISYATPTVMSNHEVGCHKITIATVIPQELPIGTYIRSCTYKYSVNPLRTVVIKMSTDKFEVISSK